MAYRLAVSSSDETGRWTYEFRQPGQKIPLVRHGTPEQAAKLLGLENAEKFTFTLEEIEELTSP